MSNDSLQQGVTKLLSESGYEIAAADAAPIAQVAQNESVLIFMVDGQPDLSLSVEKTVAMLVKPFRSKSFGPKTLEMYAIFICDGDVSRSLVEKYEQDVRICRKIVLTSSDDYEARLAFLKPLRTAEVELLDVGQLFWSRLRDDLTPREASLLEDLNTTDIPIKALPDYLKKSE
jgi:hypothetical protein